MKEKAFIHRLLTAAVALLVMSCSSEEAQVQAQNYATMTQKMYITIDGRTESVTLADNSVTFSLSQPTGISQIRGDEDLSRAYTLQGTLVLGETKGIIIRNGKKTLR
ncbi:MAG: hypothetical protein J5913_02355 [Prevotella sp.]|nr:hypothetical protein [Prevotella sp.]